MNRRTPFQPQPRGIDELEPRTQRAYAEAMQVTLERAGGRYTVHAASGNTYTVDVAAGTCTCKDHQENHPENGCKHRRRVELEIRSKRVPTPDGRVPEQVAADGGRSLKTPAQNRSDEDTRIQGPIPEFDAYGESTGAEYYRCRACGTEAMRRRDLDDCCAEADE